MDKNAAAEEVRKPNKKLHQQQRKLEIEQKMQEMSAGSTVLIVCQ